MTDTRAAWTEVGERLTSLGLKLKLHAEEELSEEGVTFKNAMGKLGTVIKESFEAVEDACQDDAVRQDVRDAANALAAALKTTADEVRASVKTQS